MRLTSGLKWQVMDEGRTQGEPSSLHHPIAIRRHRGAIKERALVGFETIKPTAFSPFERPILDQNVQVEGDWPYCGLEDWREGKHRLEL